MRNFELMAQRGHEQLVFWHEPEIGYKGIIAIHDTTMGPALGGTRFWNYETEEEAIIDSLRLARGMTYKAAITGLNLGGGKSVIIGDNRTKDREMIFRAHGRAVESLGRRANVFCRDVATTERVDETSKRVEEFRRFGLGVVGKNHRLAAAEG